MGVRQTTKPRVPAWGNKASKPLTEKNYRCVTVEETPSLTGEFVGQTHRVLERTQTHPPGIKHQKGPICLWEETETQLRAEPAALFPLGPLPHIQCHNEVMWVPPTLANT